MNERWLTYTVYGERADTSISLRVHGMRRAHAEMERLGDDGYAAAYWPAVTEDAS